jgi:hypothetical protein
LPPPALPLPTAICNNRYSTARFFAILNQAPVLVPVTCKNGKKLRLLRLNNRKTGSVSSEITQEAVYPDKRL